MNFQEYKYKIVKDALSNITGIKIIDNYAEKQSADFPYVYIEVSGHTEHTIYSGNTAVNADSQYEIKLQYGYVSKLKKAVGDDIRLNIGNLYDNIRYQLSELNFPLQHTYSVGADKKVTYTIQGIDDIGMENDLVLLNTNKEDQFLTLIFSYNVHYY